MKVLLSYPVASLSGRVDVATNKLFRRQAGVQVLASIDLDRPPRTNNQSYVQAQMRAAMAAWNSLTGTQQAAWNTWANAQPTPKDHLTAKPTGRSTFLGLYTTAAVGRQTLPTSAPTSQVTRPVVGLGYFRYEVGSAVFRVQILWPTGTATGHRYKIETSPSSSLATAPFIESEMRLGNQPYPNGSFIAETSGTFASRTLATPSYTWTVGQYLWVRVTAYSPNWWPASPITFRQLITQV